MGPLAVASLQDVKQNSAVLLPPVKTSSYGGQPANSNSEAAKPESPDPPLFVAPAKSGGSGLFDALLMAAATGMLGYIHIHLCQQVCEDLAFQLLYFGTSQQSEQRCCNVTHSDAMSCSSNLSILQC